MENHQKQSSEIDLMSLLQRIFNSKWLLIKGISLVFVVSLVFAMLYPKDYESKVVFLPSSSPPNSKLSGLSSNLASLVGIDLMSSSSSSEVSPLLYPRVVNSVSFNLKLLECELTYKGQKMTYREYYENHHQPSFFALVKSYTIGLPKKLFSKKGGTEVMKDSLFINLSRTDFDHIERLKGQVNATVDVEEGVISLSASMPFPRMAAEMTAYAGEELKQQLTTLRVKSAKQELSYIQKAYNEKQAAFDSAHHALALYRDQNADLNSAVALTEQQALETKYNLAFNVYNEMAKQLELAKLKVQKETPDFSVIEPIRVPEIKSGPSRAVLAIVLFFLGSMLVVLWAMFRTPLKNLLTDLKS